MCMKKLVSVGLHIFCVLVCLPKVLAQQNNGINWATVAVAWCMSTITTVLILVITVVCYKRFKILSIKKEEPIERDDALRKSNQSNNTRVTIISSTADENRHSTGSGHRRSRTSSQPRTPSGSGAGGFEPPRHMPRSISDETGPQSRRTRDETSKWCTQHNLPESVANILRARGFTSTFLLESLKPEDVPKLDLQNVALECYVRQALEKKYSHPNVSTGSSSGTGFTRGKRSQSDDQLENRNTTQDHSEPDVQVPLLDRARSYNNMDECDGPQQFAAGLQGNSKTGMDRSYDVINDEHSTFPSSTSAIELRLTDTSQTSMDVKSKRHKKSHKKQLPLLAIYHGLLSDEGLYVIASKLGIEWQQLATLLKVPPSIQEQIKMSFPSNAGQQIYEMLRHWRDNAQGEKEEVKGQLHRCLARVKRQDIADMIMHEQVHGSEQNIARQHSVI